MSKTEELLAVLDMTEEEQGSWCSSNVDCVFFGCLADLAFRLRDEVCKTQEGMVAWKEARNVVYKYVTKDWRPGWLWWWNCAKPIHWIIAALIAKEKPDGK